MLWRERFFYVGRIPRIYFLTLRSSGTVWRSGLTTIKPQTPRKSLSFEQIIIRMESFTSARVSQLILEFALLNQFAVWLP